MVERPRKGARRSGQQFIRGVGRDLALQRKFWLLDAEQAHYLRRIRQSGLFDRDFYRSQHPLLLPMFLRFPERHYVAFGEQAGFFPRPDFSPVAYRRRNEEVAASERPPFLHFIEHGREAGLPTRDPSPVIDDVEVPPVPEVQPRAAFAVVVHVYYPDLWHEIERALQNVDIDFDLYVTITCLDAESNQIAEAIGRDWPGATVLTVPNHGRDIFPWVHLVNAGVLSRYRSICKLHTKRSPHLADGDQWRRRLVESLLPGRATGELLQRFLDDDRAGVLVVAGQHLAGERWRGANWQRVAELLQRVGIQPDASALNFAAGSIYWLKSEVIEAIERMGLQVDDFEPEQGATDGTTAHAFERTLGYLAAGAGLEIRETAA